MGRTQSEIMEEREDRVDRLIAEMKEQGYSLNDLSVDGDKANKAALLIGAVVSTVIALLFGLLWGWSNFGDVDFPLSGIGTSSLLQRLRSVASAMCSSLAASDIGFSHTFR